MKNSSKWIIVIGLIFFLIVVAIEIESFIWLVFMLMFAILYGLGLFFTGKDLKKNEEIMKKEKEEKLHRYNSLKEKYTITKEYIDNNSTNAILLNDENNIMVLIYNDMKDLKTFNYSDILQVEVIKDGETISKTNRKSQFGGAIVGGILAGEVGALIGGLSGETNVEEKVNSIDLKILVNDTNKPTYSINFFRAPFNKSTKKIEPADIKSSTEYQAGAKEIEQWYSIITVIIKRTEKENHNINTSKQTENTDVNKPSSLRIEDLNKLADLYKQGLLSRDEFEFEKKKILDK